MWDVLHLPDVMLCAVSSVAVEQTVAALRKSCAGIRFGDVVLLSDVAVAFDQGEAIRWQAIPPLRSKEAYSQFMIRDLGRYVTRPFVLVTQWDGYVLNPGAWDPAFFDCDYIGAPWPQFDDGMTVGNGGFSLRSRRLVELLGTAGFTPAHPEDTMIGRIWRRTLEAEHGMRFADPPLAARFSTERSGDLATTFGFHGFYNLPDVMPFGDLQRMLAALEPRVLLGLDGEGFIQRLAEKGYRGFALRQFARRLAQAPGRRSNLRLAQHLARNFLKYSK